MTLRLVQNAPPLIERSEQDDDARGGQMFVAFAVVSMVSGLTGVCLTLFVLAAFGLL